MHKIKIRLPATITRLGPALNSLGLALGLYTSVEISERADEALVVETDGEGAGRYSIGLRHPVMLALMRMFQRIERAPLGITVRIHNTIPLASGLGAESAFMVAGVIGANNLMGNPYSRDQMLDVASQVISRPGGTVTPNAAVTTILGGLTASAANDQGIIYRSLPLTPFKVIVVVPELDAYARPVMMDRVPLQDVAYNVSRLPLMMDAFRSGDVELLADVLQDRLRTPLLTPNIPGYAEVSDAAKQIGALTVTVCGDGPALLALANVKHEKVVDAMVEAFKVLHIKARGWVLPIDTQGVVISVMQSA